MAREIHLELLLNQPLRAPSGASVGRIEEIRVNDKGEIVEFLLGPEALLKRWIGKFRRAQPLRVFWKQIEWTPDGPRLHGAILVQPRAGA